MPSSDYSLKWSSQITILVVNKSDTGCVSPVSGVQYLVLIIAGFPVHGFRNLVSKTPRSVQNLKIVHFQAREDGAGG